jgi:hypothetical protein
MFTGGLIIVGAPNRFFRSTTVTARPKANHIIRAVCWLWQHPTTPADAPAQSWRNFAKIWWYEFRQDFNCLAILFLLLLISSLLANLYRQAAFSWRLGAVIIGVIAAFLVAIIALTLLLLLRLAYDKLSATGIAISLRSSLKTLFVKIGKLPYVAEFINTFHDGYQDLDKETPFTHRRAAFLFVVAALTYALGYWLLNPAHPNFIVRHTPPLAYFIVLIALAALILPSLSYYLDRFRIPVLPIILVIYCISYLLGADHFYEFAAPPTLSAASTQSVRTPQEVVAAWNRHYGPDQHPIMVVVAASGGGIKAAAWTAHVLESLQNDPQLDRPFAESITLASTVSGGSVGAMYALDHYRRPELARTNAFNQASASSLNAIAWGLTYPDLLRTIGPLNLLVDKTNDRAAAVEYAWRAQLTKEWDPQLPQEPPTLLTWPQTIEKRWQPLQIFNTTIAETGQRLLLSPVEIPSPPTVTRLARAQNFTTLYPGCDLSVITAARLSATFPYVTPIARPLAAGPCAPNPETLYHLADGGYYDNFGLMTVIEFLGALTPQAYKEQFQRHKILLVQIRASPLEEVKESSASTNGLKYASLGPGLTALQVQTATQIGRNDLELDLLKQNWAREGVIIESVVFELSKEVVLSWHLSDQEKQDIIAEFCKTRNQNNLEKLKQFWGVPNPTAACPQPPPLELSGYEAEERR